MKLVETILSSRRGVDYGYILFMNHLLIGMEITGSDRWPFLTEECAVLDQHLFHQHNSYIARQIEYVRFLTQLVHCNLYFKSYTLFQIQTYLKLHNFAQRRITTSFMYGQRYWQRITPEMIH